MSTESPARSHVRLWRLACLVVNFVWLLTGCHFTTPAIVQPTSPVVTTANSPTTEPSATLLPLTPTATKWGAQIQMASDGYKTHASPTTLWRLVPGSSTLQDLYDTAGYPVRRKDYPEGIALLYPSLWIKDPHIVLLDGRTQKVLVVAIENVSKPVFSLPNLEAQYGKPVKAYSDGRDYLFFLKAGLAVIADGRDNNDIVYVQMLPKDMPLDSYQAHQGFSAVTFGFVP